MRYSYFFCFSAVELGVVRILRYTKNGPCRGYCWPLILPRNMKRNKRVLPLRYVIIERLLWGRRCITFDFFFWWGRCLRFCNNSSNDKFYFIRESFQKWEWEMWDGVKKTSLLVYVVSEQPLTWSVRRKHKIKIFTVVHDENLLIKYCKIVK